MGSVIPRLPPIRVILSLRRIRLSGRTTRGGSFVALPCAKRACERSAWVPPQDDTLLATGTGSFGVRHFTGRSPGWRARRLARAAPPATPQAPRRRPRRVVVLARTCALEPSRDAQSK